MNTFHSDLKNDLQNTINITENQRLTDQNYLSDQFCEKDHMLELQEFEKIQSINSRIRGNYIAIKLSKIRELNLSIQEIASLYSGNIVIDAEFDRLDIWLNDALQSGQIVKSLLSRLIITVQVKRKDAFDQLNSMSQYRNQGLQILLVAGHESYLVDVEQTTKGLIESFYSLSRHSFVKYYGISSNMRKRLKHAGLEIDTSQTIELQGYHNLENSMLWTYYGGVDLTQSATSYLSRRSDKNREFICRKVEDLVELATKYSLVIFLDSCCKYLLVSLLEILESSRYFDKST